MQPWARLQKPVVVLTKDIFKEEEMQPLNREYTEVNPFLQQPARSSFLLWSNRCPKPLQPTQMARTVNSVEDPAESESPMESLERSAKVVNLQGVNDCTSVPYTALSH